MMPNQTQPVHPIYSSFRRLPVPCLFSQDSGVRRNDGFAIVHGFSWQSGLTLLEVMVTVVILSLGLLGLAGLQMTGLKNNRNAYYQTVAAQGAQDLAERVKADQAGARGATYDTFVQKADNTKCKGGGAGLSDSAACLAAALPGGQARITASAGTPKRFYVALRWSDVEMVGQKGWGADAPNANPPTFATTACGDPVNGENCYYTLIVP